METIRTGRTATYDRTELAASVAEAECLAEVIVRCGGRPTNGSRAYVRKLIARWEIDASHLRSGAVRHTERRLREAVAVSHSIAEVVRRLGVGPVGGNEAHIGRRIARLGIDTSHFTSGARDGEVRRRKRARADPLVLGSPGDGRIPGARLRKALLRTGIPEACALCRTGPWWMGEPLRLEVDHLNGDWWDNRIENLRILCPNCHATTDTFRGRKRRGALR
ncbi:HNH endonuclease [Streptomyces sp. PTM05]|uniref:HNH endonuclease n=1 Tax=Streptantibioticus parmotrematis TaxID=2873249 RepID=A0ABS7QYF2_9ACTN|nr:HNH endonuclease [Streptantibioticus parmotrematis]MBY8887958.1 HNH endonuclease [Streptantibioticus parmotrematis]